VIVHEHAAVADVHGGVVHYLVSEPCHRIHLWFGFTTRPKRSRMPLLSSSGRRQPSRNVPPLVRSTDSFGLPILLGSSFMCSTSEGPCTRIRLPFSVTAHAMAQSHGR